MQTTSINVISKTASSFHAVNFQRAGAPSRLRRRQWQRPSSSPAATGSTAAASTLPVKTLKAVGVGETRLSAQISRPIRCTCHVLRVYCGNEMGETSPFKRSTFLPRDDMRKRGHCCGPVSVRPSLRLSVCHVRAFYPDG